MDVLLTFTGFHDPFFKGLIGQAEQPGPILSLLSVRSFERIYLFDTPATQKLTKNTKKAIAECYDKSQIEVLTVDLSDPTDYQIILKQLRNHLHKLQEKLVGGKFFISVASGTPQMHACWVLLANSGEIPVRVLHVRPPHFVTKGKPLVSEIDFTSRYFPVVRFLSEKFSEKDDQELDFQTVSKQLGFVGDHPLMVHVLETGAMLASSNVPILILGETGTGKELLAHFIHRLSGRHKYPFVPVNCAAIPENLVESLLFGHKKGAFTGAMTGQNGKFDNADKGTLFLDELGDLPLSAQAKLLRILQDGLVEPIGDRKPHRVDVRIVAATNRDLLKLVKQGKFREDLYYRLNVGELKIPPLRERRSDIPRIALQILDHINGSIRKPKKFSPEALSRLQAHNWPGNVRDLENVLERSARLCSKDVIEADDLLISEPIVVSDPLVALPDPHEGFLMDEFLASARKQLLMKALEASGGNQSRAARLLGVTPQAVHKFLQQMKE